MVVCVGRWEGRVIGLLTTSSSLVVGSVGQKIFDCGF